MSRRRMQEIGGIHQTEILRSDAKVLKPTFSLSSDTVEKQTRNRINNDYSAIKSYISDKDTGTCSLGGAADRSRVVEIAKVKGDNNVIKVDCNICSMIQAQNNSQENLGPTFKEDMSSTIDEAALSVHDDSIISGKEKSSHEGIRHAEYEYDYARSVNLHHTETEDLCLTDDTYMSPINDHARSYKICQDEESNVLGTDQTYITPIDDSSCPIEIC
ncbi:hypothetical protein CHS0354_030005 [Potamilus streckersoni]|uniref:Uncharacterized protein n=1 Tax=Potamilus streckersoni TaxID=2493646 RepID=A0AAE0SMK0_9BIVA|nr:hypothetical protein CHS0354_030005 [Potamilus streckersoni]